MHSDRMKTARMKQRHMAVVALAAAACMVGARTSAGELTQAEMKGFLRTVRAHVQELRTQEEDGAFVVHDEKLDKDWRLKFIRLHGDVSQLSERAYSVCADFKEVDGKTKLDVDFIVNRLGSGWAVRQTVVHAVGGKSRIAQETAAAPLKRPEAAGAVFVCPMGDYSGPRTPDGRCPKCGMNLIEKK